MQRFLKLLFVKQLKFEKMKKILVAFVAIVAISFASCVNGNTEKAECDSTQCEGCGACKCDSCACEENPCTCDAEADTVAVEEAVAE